MSQNTNIEWTEATWNPIRGCSRVSEGCRNCYAERQAIRHAGPGGSYEGLVKISNGHPQWTGKVQFVEKHLNDPLKWKEPRRIFVNSMSDLFHEQVPFPVIDQVYGIIGLAAQHTFQILTKRPHRALEYFQSRDWKWAKEHFIELPGKSADGAWVRRGIERAWNGVSVENQPTADQRISIMLQWPTGKAIRWISAEPLLEHVNLRAFVGPVPGHPGLSFHGGRFGSVPALDWVVVGGESGPGARACNVRGIILIVQDCQAARVPVFVKQLGAKPAMPSCASVDCTHPDCDPGWMKLKDKKGGDITEWPQIVRVREFPKLAAEAAHV